MTCPYGNNVHVIGIAGSEAAAVLKFLRNTYPRLQLTGHDSSTREEFLRNFKEAHIGLGTKTAVERGRELLQLEGVHFQFGGEYLEGIEQADSLFVPQSWYLYEQNEPLKVFQEKFCSITRLYFDLFPGKIIGITGSNGKTSTSTMIAEIMRRAYPRTLYSGNDRRTEQVLDRLDQAERDDWLVLEISNRQLMADLGKSPDISVITNITPNHLSEYNNFEEYAAVKKSMLKYQTARQWSVLNDDDPESRELIERDGGETMPFSTEHQLPKGVFVRFGQIIIKHADREEVTMKAGELPLLGKHSLANALAATAATHLAGVKAELIAQTLRSLEPIPQRLESVQTVLGVTYYNDSASTAPESTLAALDTLQQPQQALYVILGGKSKGSDYQPLAEALQKTGIRPILLSSPLADELKSLFEKKAPAECETLQQALQFAKENAQAGDRVVLSPAGEYFSYFRDKMTGYKNFRDI
ncbi:MAG: UDP-N-acetylmuramoyl-L-alanine--D-glutamate ligase, partial [bacterium]|nr:UDP-N-acetylmuramoyl-L-alanine--D-glutamate ligase [bacterium]